MALLAWLLLALALAGCSRGQPEAVIGEGFVVPETLNLRAELGPQQPAVATVRHGEKVEILARRRRFVKVRTSAGAAGWVDGSLLFSPEQIEQLRAVARRAARLPSQGEATVFDALNVHTDPDRGAPSFHQIRPGQQVSILEHRLVPRASPGLAPDDWLLVRLSPEAAGWVLGNMLFMAIPDEVAQYAEGHRITSYFSLGEVRDEDRVQHNWLWTTITKGREPYQFDSFRVFMWSLRRHRYETAYIERNLRGYYPVTVETPPGAPPRFSLPVEDKDGTRYLRTYTFQGYRVRMVAKVPWVAPPEPAAETAAPPAPPRDRPWFIRLRDRLTGAGGGN
ncbi:MAG: SH3 domain-containing protein [Bryobacterales bacterium]|nr:SH3 domain-containing protein [Bryobacterales bacterium]